MAWPPRVRQAGLRPAARDPLGARARRRGPAAVRHAPAGARTGLPARHGRGGGRHRPGAGLTRTAQPDRPERAPAEPRARPDARPVGGPRRRRALRPARPRRVHAERRAAEARLGTVPQPRGRAHGIVRPLDHGREPDGRRAARLPGERPGRQHRPQGRRGQRLPPGERATRRSASRRRGRPRWRLPVGSCRTSPSWPASGTPPTRASRRPLPPAAGRWSAGSARATPRTAGWRGWRTAPAG